MLDTKVNLNNNNDKVNGQVLTLIKPQTRSCSVYWFATSYILIHDPKSEKPFWKIQENEFKPSCVWIIPLNNAKQLHWFINYPRKSMNDIIPSFSRDESLSGHKITFLRRQW